MTGNTTLLKSERIILPEKLQQKAIALPRKGSHPSKSQISGNTTKVTLLIPCMQSKVINYVNTCIDCKMFMKKKLQSCWFNKVPTKNWEAVVVDLVGPMPSSNHVILVQDLGSRYRAAQLVRSTKAEVIPALKELYN